MSLPFPLHLTTPWLSPVPFPSLGGLSVDPRYQEVLSSTDSLTRRLEQLTGSPSRVRLEDQSVPASREESSLIWGPEYHLSDPGTQLPRTAWLTLGNAALLFAHSPLI
ncbi:MAG: hypothetical protein HQL95_14705, partial [Magnetococcales bacterium]|nr:hypothetical protein [Magnetococcales bacterium]